MFDGNTFRKFENIPPYFLPNMYRASFPGVELPGVWR